MLSLHAFESSVDKYVILPHGALIFIIIVAIILRLLHLLESSEKPKLFHSGSIGLLKVLNRCPSIHKSYRPTFLWGKSGHVQSLLLCKYGRFNITPHGYVKERHTLFANDGASVVYDMFRPDCEKKVSNDDKKRLPIVVVVPGIGNHSDTVYVQGFICYCVSHGFTVAVYNHLGADKNTTLTSPRVFTYGATDDLELVVNDLQHKNNSKQKFIGVGFSMGGNILLKFLGENPCRQSLFICAASVCQGYDISRASKLFLEWANMRRGYNWAVTQVMKSMLLRHAKQISKLDSSDQLVDKLHWDNIRSASSLNRLDDYVKCFDGFDSNEEFYRWSSSASYMKNLHLPVLLINASDDPMVPEVLLSSAKCLVDHNRNACLMVPKHGGHLGFFEGGLIRPNCVSWLDRVLVEYIEANICPTNDD